MDNLKLGYGGTKTEMQRLINDANEVKRANGEMADLSIDSFASIVEAIHIVQTEMGITGTTAKEASETISGSVASMKSAWQNLITAFADENQDLGALVDKFVSSFDTALDNLLPRIEVALGGISTFFQKITPIIIEKLPSLTSIIINGLLGSVTNFLTYFGEVLPDLIGALVPIISEHAPKLIRAGIELTQGLVSGFVQAIAEPDVLNTIFQTIKEIAGIMIERRIEMVKAAISFVKSLADGLVENIDEIVPKVKEFVGKAVDFVSQNASDFIKSAKEILSAIGAGIVDNAENIVPKVKEFLSKIVSFVSQNAPILIDAALNIVQGIGWYFSENAKEIVSGINDFMSKIVAFFTNTENLKQLATAAIDIILGLVTGITTNAIKMLPAVVELIAAIAVALTDSEVLSQLTNIAIGIITGLVGVIIKILEDTAIVEKLVESATAILIALVEAISDSMPTLMTAAVQIITNLITFLLADDNIGKIVQAAVGIVVALGSALMSNAGQILNGVSALIEAIVKSLFETDWLEVGQQIGTSILQGILDIFDLKGDLDKIQNPSGIDWTNPPKPKNPYDDFLDNYTKTDTEPDLGIESIPALEYEPFNNTNNRFNPPVIVQNIYSQAQTAADLAQETQWEARRTWISEVEK